jgi:hypothetical protein
VKASGEIPLTEAEIVVSAGRGLKGPENWGMVEDLARVLHAATACSRPVADAPHLHRQSEARRGSHGRHERREGLASARKISACAVSGGRPIPRARARAARSGSGAG